jgi:hypothetical protein
MFDFVSDIFYVINEDFATDALEICCYTFIFALPTISFLLSIPLVVYILKHERKLFFKKKALNMNGIVGEKYMENDSKDESTIEP